MNDIKYFATDAAEAGSMTCNASPAKIYASPAKFYAKMTKDHQFSLHGATGEPMVTIDLNNQTLSFGPGYEPDEAAKIFWDAVQAMIPRRD